MTYPRVEKIDNLKLKTLLEEKTKSVIEGREISQEIEEVEAEMEQIDLEIQAFEKKVDISDLNDKSKQITDEFNAVTAKMQALQKELFDRIKAEVPPDLGVKYHQKKVVKEELENKRNKIALKIQKWKDKIIPLTQKVAKPYLKEEYEDFHDIRLENGEVILEIFSHLEDFKERHKKKLQQ